MTNKKSYQISDRRKITYHKIFPYLLIAPVFLYVLVFLVFPFLYGIGISLTDKKIGGEASFIGFQNYLTLLQDKKFVKSITNTLEYTVISVGLKVILGMAMALVLNSRIRGRTLARGLLLIPWAVPTTVSIYVWKWMFSDAGGVLNAMLTQSGIVSQKIAWLSTPLMAMISIVIVNVWRGAPFIGISVLSGLQTISADLYESATVDGAGTVAKFIYVTLPSIKNVLMLATLVTTIWTFNDFEIIWLLTKGGPLNSTQVISTYSYQAGILQMDFGKAVAASVMFLPIIIILVNIVTGYTLKKEE